MNYFAENIDSNKFLEEIERKRKRAEVEHSKNIAVENARYEQEMKTLDKIEDMFHCANYEK